MGSVREAQIENLANGVSEPTKDEMIRRALELIEQKQKETVPERIFVIIFKDKTEKEGLKELVNKYKWK
ncbi:MAG: hypothetical protein ACTTI5_04375 [Treponema sp.]